MRVSFDTDGRCCIVASIAQTSTLQMVGKCCCGYAGNGEGLGARDWVWVKRTAVAAYVRLPAACCLLASCPKVPDSTNNSMALHTRLSCTCNAYISCGTAGGSDRGYLGVPAAQLLLQAPHTSLQLADADQASIPGTAPHQNDTQSQCVTDTVTIHSLTM